MANNKLFVGGLPFETTEEQLQEMFTEYGEITSVNLIKDRDSGRSKGFGFVEYADDSEAKAAIDAMHNSEVGGRKISVDVARPKRENNRRF